MGIYQRCALILLVLMGLNQSAFADPVKLSLDDSIAMALQNNHDIKYAASAREKAYWAVAEAKGNKRVSIDYTHTDQRYNTPPSTTSSTYVYTTDFDNQLSLSLPLYSGKKLENQIEQAKLDLQVADLDVDVAKQGLKVDVVTDYFTVLEYLKEVQVNQGTVNNYQDHLDQVNAKYELGLVAKTDVLSSRVNLANAQDDLIKAKNNYHNAVATLNNAIGLAHDTELELKDDFTYEKYPSTLEECLRYAELHRPEIAQYQAKVASAQYDVKIAKSGNLPTVDLTAEQDWYDDHLPGSENSNWLLKLTTSFNVFDSGVTKSQVKQAVHNVDMVKEKEASERDSILLNVREYYLSMQEAEKRIDTNKVSVEQAEENLKIQKVSYDVGVGTNLDLLDAILDLSSAKKDYFQALYDHNTNKAKLEQAMGLPVR